MYQFGSSAFEQLDKMSKRMSKGVDFAHTLASLSARQSCDIREKVSAGLLDQAGQAAEVTTSLNPGRLMRDWVDYVIDSAQRSVLFLDLLRRRGNQYLDHVEAGCPPVLVFDYTVLVDGRTLKRPVNYALVQITPPQGVRIDMQARPYVIIDPRAGHGAGIGGFKADSQVGVALNGGHAVYFVIFYPDPEPGQTILDVCAAEGDFMQEVRRRHPEARKPVVIGNCQGGWATMMLAAHAPEVTGPIVMNGAPLSYWAGENGKNPMRYIGGLLGGSWPALMMADLGNGRFDGANLVANFENLNPANSLWSKYYNVYKEVDTQAPRFLEFEKWWGGFSFMNEEEIAWIVDNLFVGNKFSQGRLQTSRHDHFDMRAIKSPILVFASAGDNITPPQQALNWIADNYTDVREIKARGQVIVYLLHEDIGHLGIFVSGAIARKEHKEIVHSLRFMERLRPGLYEMKIEDLTEPVDGMMYKVDFEERTIRDILDMDDGRADERAFEVVSRISDITSDLYKTVMRPWVRAFTTEQSAELCHNAHSLRMKRVMISDKNPLMAPVGPLAAQVKSRRRPAKPGNFFTMMQELSSAAIEYNLNFYRDLRDTGLELGFHMTYGLLDQFYEADKTGHQQDDADLKDEDLIRLPEVQAVLAKMRQGGFKEAVVRMMVLMAQSRGGVRRSRLERANEVVTRRAPFAVLSEEERNTLIHEQSLMVEVSPDDAMATLADLIADMKERRQAIDIIKYVAGPDDEMAEASKDRLAQLIRALGL